MSGIKRPFSTFRLLSFDIYGTLIDWEKGIIDALSPIQARLPSSCHLKTDNFALASVFNKHEARLQAANPAATYNTILREAYIAVATELLLQEQEQPQQLDKATILAEGIAFADSIDLWPAFPDTVNAMRKLKQLGFILVPLSNVDHASFAKTLAGPLAGLNLKASLQQQSGSDATNDEEDRFFDAVYTAQDIGSYKPDLRNFEYLISHAEAQFGVEKHEILHVAQSLMHDHISAKQIGLESVWIARGEGGVTGMGGDVETLVRDSAFGWRFKDLGDFADAVESEMKGTYR